MKTTSTGRWPQNIKSWISQQPITGSSSDFKLNVLGLNQKHSGDQPNSKMLEMKPTSNEKNKNTKSWISQPQLIWPFSNFKLKLWGQNQIKKFLKWRRTPIEDTLKLLNVEYLINH